MTAVKKWENKTVYHSYLAREGRLMVKLKGDPFESKFKAGQMVVYFQVPDDDTEYALNLEPETVQDVIAAPKGVWLTATAFGTGKDDPKSLKFSDGAGPVLPGDDYEPMDGPPPMWPDDEPAPAPAPPKAAPPTGSVHPTVLKSAEMTIAAVRLLEAAGIRADSDAAARIYNTHFIQASRG